MGRKGKTVVRICYDNFFVLFHSLWWVSLDIFPVLVHS